jgi:hypothetical protein
VNRLDEFELRQDHDGKALVTQKQYWTIPRAAPRRKRTSGSFGALDTYPSGYTAQS